MAGALGEHFHGVQDDDEASHSLLVPSVPAAGPNAGGATTRSPELSPSVDKNRRRLTTTALVVSLLGISWNVAEGLLSLTFGVSSESKALTFFGADSFVEVFVSVVVFWRFYGELTVHHSLIPLERERNATFVIGASFVLLFAGTVAAVVPVLIARTHPETTLPGIIISSVTIFMMFLIYTAQSKLASKLNSSTMKSQADCSMADIKLSTVLLIGSVVYHFWPDGWWIDSSVALLLSVFFLKEGVETIIHACSQDFTGCA
eukprot:TRINITY_DN16329_c0_g1_i1.p1 TRINITY_DN16329_c0_g1~~TRINITY_DN16329_c0_g1_i1.p1  ORF type:complete len:260 (+),score=63.88 TRINITY_DN16329_c0_g1_i1:62-841(+)